MQFSCHGYCVVGYPLCGNTTPVFVVGLWYGSICRQSLSDGLNIGSSASVGSAGVPAFNVSNNADIDVTSNLPTESANNMSPPRQQGRQSVRQNNNLYPAEPTKTHE